MLKRILSIISFDSDVIVSVSNDEQGHQDAYVVLLAVALLSSALAFAFPARFGIAESLGQLGVVGQAFSWVFAAGFTFLLMVAGVWISSFLYDLVASVLGGSGSPTRLFRVFALAAPLSLLTYLPVVGWLVSAWVLALDVYVLKQVEDFSLGRAVGTVLVLVGAVLVLAFVVIAAFVGFAGVPAGPGGL